MGRKFIIYEVIEENPKESIIGTIVALIILHFVILHFTGYSLFGLVMSLARRVLSLLGL